MDTQVTYISTREEHLFNALKLKLLSWSSQGALLFLKCYSGPVLKFIWNLLAYQCQATVAAHCEDFKLQSEVLNHLHCGLTMAGGEVCWCNVEQAGMAGFCFFVGTHHFIYCKILYISKNDTIYVVCLTNCINSQVPYIFLRGCNAIKWQGPLWATAQQGRIIIY